MLHASPGNTTRRSVEDRSKEAAAKPGDPVASQQLTTAADRMSRIPGNQARLRMLAGGATMQRPSITPMPLQRKCGCGGICPDCAGERALRRQPAAISEPGDALEQQADRVADEVMRMPAPSVQAKADASNSRQGGDGTVPAGVPSIVGEVLRSPGHSLDRQTRAFMEPRFGHDFGAVRLHTDAVAAHSAREVNADAYTVGRNVVFGSEQFAPTTERGRRLLAHELAHTVQQGAAASLTLIQRQAESYDRDPLTAALTPAEWQMVKEWQFTGVAGPIDKLTDDPDYNAEAVAAELFCSRFLGSSRFLEDNDPPQLCVLPDVTKSDSRVQTLKSMVTQNGPIRNLAYLAGPLTDPEWKEVEHWQARGSVGPLNDPLTADPEHNADIVAAAVFCSRFLGSGEFVKSSESPALCVIPGTELSDPRVQFLRKQVSARGPIIHWAAVAASDRKIYVMKRLIDHYEYPVNGAAGLVGNLWSESALIPSRIESSSEATPMNAPSLSGPNKDFTADEVMDRNTRTNKGPDKPGIGLAQWTTSPRREKLFQFQSDNAPAGPGVLFNMDAQIDYLVTELTSANPPTVNNVLTNPGVSLNDASDEVVFNFEIPQAVLAPGGGKLPRTDAAVQAVFRQRRNAGQSVLSAYQEDQKKVQPGSGNSGGSAK